MTVRIHIGAHKTATSHLQQGLQQAARALARSDIAYLGPRRLRTAPTDLRHLLSDPARMPWRAGQARDALRWQVEHHDNLLISDELIQGETARRHLFGGKAVVYPLAATRLGNLIDLLGVAGVTVFLGLRAPADFLLSAFGEELRAGRERRIEDYLADVAVSRLRWSDLVSRLLALNRIERLVCWRFEDYAQIRLPLLARLVGEDLAARIPDLPPRRPGWTIAAYEHFLAASRDRQREDWRALAQAARDRFPKHKGAEGLAVLAEALPMPPDYAADCARISGMDRVEFLWPRSEQG